MNSGVFVGAFLPTLGRVARWLVPRRLLVRLWLVRGLCCALRVLDGCFVSLFLDSNPAWLLGPPAKRFAHIVWVGFESPAVR